MEVYIGKKIVLLLFGTFVSTHLSHGASLIYKVFKNVSGFIRVFQI